jgi:Xaa-Pro aminopeptidase
MLASRLSRLRAAMAELPLPAFLVTQGDNVGYLSGFTGSTAALIVTAADAVMVTDSRYTVQARRECPGFDVRQTELTQGLMERVAADVKALGIRSLGVEGSSITVTQFAAMKIALEGIELRPAEEIVEKLRLVKDESEIALIRQACGIVDQAFAFILTQIKPGIRERDLAIELEYFMKKAGSEKEAFDTIVASGARSALPHGRASDKPLEIGDFVTFDFGGRVGGYHSDLTRTVVLGPATERHREVYQVVLDAQLAALAAIRPGMTGKEADQVARDVITARGFGENFGHGLGHGLGRHVHDGGGMSQRVELTLEAGMVMTVEPGVYLEGWGGVRIEDDVVIRDGGVEILTHATKALIEIECGG